MAEVKDNSSIQLFEDQKIRTAWDAEMCIRDRLMPVRGSPATDKCDQRSLCCSALGT